MMKIEAERHLHTLRITAVNGKRLIGECQRCGWCCRNAHCEYLKMETLNGKVNAVCIIYNRRPIACALWPLPDEVDDCQMNAYRYE